MKYVIRSEMQNQKRYVMHEYKDGVYPVFESAEEYRKYYESTPDAVLRERASKLYDKEAETAFLGDGLTRHYYEGQLMESCEKQVRRDEEKRLTEVRDQMMKGAQKVEDYVFLCRDHYMGHGDYYASCHALAANEQVAKDIIEVCKEDWYHPEYFYVNDKEDNRLCGISEEEESYKPKEDTAGREA